MSGRRARALRRAFIKEHGRTPGKAKLQGYRGHEAAWLRDELRPIKKAWTRRNRLLRFTTLDIAIVDTAATR